MILNIAHYIITKCNELEKPVNPWKLQRYLYLIQIFGNFMFTDDFEAWDFGPTIPSVHREYYHYGLQNIPTPDCDIYLDITTKYILDIIISVLTKLDTQTIIDLTTNENSAWCQCYDKNHHNLIPKTATVKHIQVLKNKIPV